MDFSDSTGAQAAAWAVDFAVVRHDDGEQRRIVKKKWPSLVPRWFSIREMRPQILEALIMQRTGFSARPVAAYLAVTFNIQGAAARPTSWAILPQTHRSRHPRPG